MAFPIVGDPDNLPILFPFLRWSRSVCSDVASFWSRIILIVDNHQQKCTLKRNLFRTSHCCIPGTGEVQVLYPMELQM